VSPPFDGFYFVDMDSEKIAYLRKLCQGRSDVHFHEGNSNSYLTTQLLPTIQYKDYKRALCLLDPYGLHLDWEVMLQAGQSKAIRTTKLDRHELRQAAVQILAIFALTCKVMAGGSSFRQLPVMEDHIDKKLREFDEVLKFKIRQFDVGFFDPQAASGPQKNEGAEDGARGTADYHIRARGKR
jgi:hypothetical protein